MQEHPDQTANAAADSSPHSALIASKFARTCVLAALMLVGIEGAARFRAYLKYGSAGTQPDIYVTDADLGALPRAGAVTSTSGARTTINRWGLRGGDCSIEKPAGVLRVLCLGESTTFGQPGDDDADIWPAQLEQDLRRAGTNVEVLNGAVIGFSVGQTRIRFERELERFNPDIVVIYHAATNIAAHARRQFSPGVTQASESWSLAQMRDQYSLAYNLLRSNTATLLASQFPGARHDRLDEKGVTFFEQELTSLVNMCRSNGAQVVICTFPRAFDPSQPEAVCGRLAQTALFFNPQLSIRGLADAYKRYNATIRRVATEDRLLLADLDGTLSTVPDNFIDSVHLSAKGHKQAADLIAETLKRSISSYLATGEAGTTDVVQ